MRLIIIIIRRIEEVEKTSKLFLVNNKEKYTC